MSFLRSLPPYGSARDAVILGAISTGNLDAPDWCDVQCGPVTLTVSADYLKIQGERVPMAAPVAQAAVDALDAVLPTPKIVETIEAAATIVPMPTRPPEGAKQLSAEWFAWCEEETNKRMVGISGLVAGHRKDVVICRGMAQRPGRVWIFGARWPNGKRIQPLSGVHEASFADDSHGVRAIRDACLVNGEPARVSEILRDPARATWLSSEGALTFVRYPVKAVAPAPVAPAPTWTLPDGTTLRRGHRGPLVAELQRRLSGQGFVVTHDGLFGPGTEAALIEFQSERGLEADGVVGPQTRKALGWGEEEEEDTDPGEPIPFVQAKNYYPGRQKPIRVIVIHTAEIAEVNNAAENLAAWAAGPNAPMASWHFAIDADSVVQCVREEDTAFAAPGANSDGVQCELAGRAGQGAAGWADAYSQAVLHRAARLVADLCRRHGLPVVKVDAAGLLRGERGIVGHADVTLAYRQSTHTDPGASFPWEAFIRLVSSEFNG